MSGSTGSDRRPPARRPRRWRGLTIDVTPLREVREFRLLWVGDVFATFGRQILNVAVPFQVYLLTGSSLLVGVVSLAQVVPVIAGSLLGGVLADAYDRRRLIVITQVILAMTSIGLALNAHAARPALWPIVVLSVVQAGIAGIDSPARRAALPRIVGLQQLPAALALQQILTNTGKLVGPALAGVLIGQLDLAAAYWVHAGTFGGALLAVIGLPALTPEGGGRKAGWSSLVEGIAFLRGHRALQSMFLLDINAMVFGLPRALFPAIGTTLLGGGAETVGLLYAAPGAGSLLAALTSGWVAGVRHQGRAVVVSVAVWGAAITGFGLSRSLMFSLALLALAGGADMISAVFRATVVHLGAPDALRGRLQAVQKAVVSGGPNLGDARAGAVASATSPVFSVLSGGVACMIGVALLVWLYPEANRAVVTEGRLELEPA